MAVTMQNSDLVTKIFAHQHIESYKVGGDGNTVMFDFTQATEIGDAGSGFRAYRTQQGLVMMNLALSHLKFENFTAASGTALSMGHEAYTKADGTVVAEDQTAYITSILAEPDAMFLLGTDLAVTDEMSFLIDPNVTIAFWEVGADAIPIGARVRGTLSFNQG